MPKKWAVNASPLIVLAWINHLFLLQQVAEELVVPAGVVQEIAQGPKDYPARQWLLSHGQELVREMQVIPSVVIAWNLSLWETEVQAWAYENPGYEVILDDRAARNLRPVLESSCSRHHKCLVAGEKSWPSKENNPNFASIRAGRISHHNLRG
ncbi:MAG: hypothetical protein NTY36_13370 [Deltaproteobacteria bacterium]|nr:hypothetical protein [Deltaproteobacteria bacterium]